MTPEPPLYIIVCHWRRFQHYSKRSPPWIKNNVEILHKEEYLSLPEGCRAILHGLWLEYASANAQLPLNPRSLSGRLRLRVTRPQLDRLKDKGWIEYALAPCLQHASASRTREEAETEAKEETEGTSAVDNPKAPPREARPPPSNTYADELARLALDQALQTGNHTNGTKPDEPYFARLLTAVGDTEENFTKLRRAARGKPPAAVVVALEACQAPTARDRLAVALTVLGDYGKAPAA